MWIDLTKASYGIHGTAHPETIGKTESHVYDVGSVAQLSVQGEAAKEDLSGAVNDSSSGRASI